MLASLFLLLVPDVLKSRCSHFLSQPNSLSGSELTSYFGPELVASVFRQRASPPNLIFPKIWMALEYDSLLGYASMIAGILLVAGWNIRKFSRRSLTLNFDRMFASILFHSCSNDPRFAVAVTIGARFEQKAIRFNMGGEGESESQ